MSSWLIYLVLTFVNYFREQKQRQQIRSAFGFYLSPQLVEQLAKSPEKLVLGGEERRMTILFSDVRGFTTISEHYKDDPQGLTRLMNRFLTPLTNAIIERKGTIDKYIGDAIMAFWNAPLDDDDHEANACDAALEMLARAEALNVELKREAEANGGVYMPLRIGIGLNTGPCVVGNMGSDFRFNYSVLGDTVNLASRLESRTKDYRLSMVIGSRTAERAKAKFATMEIDLIQVKGKKQPEVVFTVLGRAEVDDDPRCKELRDLNAAMLASYRKQQWDEANRPDRSLPQARQRLRRRWPLRHVSRAHRGVPRRPAAAGLERRLRSGIEVTQVCSAHSRSSQESRSRGDLFRRALGEDALQGAAVHVETTRGFRNVTTAQFVDALDVLPAHAVRRHRILRRLDLPVVERQQRRNDVVGIDRLGEVIDGAEFDRIHRGRDVAVAGEDDGARFRPALLHGRYDIEPVAVAEPHVDDGEGGRGLLDLQQTVGDRLRRWLRRNLGPPSRARGAAGTICRLRRSAANARSRADAAGARVMAPVIALVMAILLHHNERPPPFLPDS